MKCNACLWYSFERSINSVAISWPWNDASTCLISAGLWRATSEGEKKREFSCKNQLSQSHSIVVGGNRKLIRIASYNYRELTFKKRNKV